MKNKYCKYNICKHNTDYKCTMDRLCVCYKKPDIFTMIKINRMNNKTITFGGCQWETIYRIFDFIVTGYEKITERLPKKIKKPLDNLIKSIIKYI